MFVHPGLLGTNHTLNKLVRSNLEVLLYEGNQIWPIGPEDPGKRNSKLVGPGTNSVNSGCVPVTTYLTFWDLFPGLMDDGDRRKA